ncbi:MAG: amphi-Trp domain-containing protein [Ilumatobacteraceae bacterium]
MKLLEFENDQRLTREEAAAQLRRLADSLERHNGLEFEREGLRYTVDVPTDVQLEVEIEVEDDGSSLEIEISWR